VRAEEFDEMRRVLPWSVYLPEADRDLLLAELIEAAPGSARLRDLEPVAELLEQWRHAAEVHADMETYRHVTAEPTRDFGRVAKPGESA
jgi:hypothetical protein